MKRSFIVRAGLVGLGMIVLLVPMAFRKITSSHLPVTVKTDGAQLRPGASVVPAERWRKGAECPSGAAGHEELGDAEVADENENQAKAKTESLDKRGVDSLPGEEKAVDAFDSLTDMWMQPSKAGVSMSDVDGFVKSFRKVPKTRRNECIHRALNLIPDENVMLLTGVLMDRRMDKAIVKTVFADILNRSDEVKKPILQEIFKDKTHPCRSDAEWIFEVTGEKPE